MREKCTAGPIIGTTSGPGTLGRDELDRRGHARPVMSSDANEEPAASALPAAAASEGDGETGAEHPARHIARAKPARIGTALVMLPAFTLEMTEDGRTSCTVERPTCPPGPPERASGKRSIECSSVSPAVARRSAPRKTAPATDEWSSAHPMRKRRPSVAERRAKSPAPSR